MYVQYSCTSTNVDWRAVVSQPVMYVANIIVDPNKPRLQRQRTTRQVKAMGEEREAHLLLGVSYVIGQSSIFFNYVSANGLSTLSKAYLLKNCYSKLATSFKLETVASVPLVQNAKHSPSMYVNVCSSAHHCGCMVNGLWRLFVIYTIHNLDKVTCVCVLIGGRHSCLWKSVCSC